MRQLLYPVVLSLFAGCHDDKRDDDRYQFIYHVATSWRLTPGGISRDAWPFGSVSAGYLTEEEIDFALDTARADFNRRWPEFYGANPPIHLTDDYVFFVPQGGFAAGMHSQGNVFLALWSRARSYDDPGNCWIKRAPGDSFGTVYDYWRYTALPLVPAYQHEVLHYCIGDPYHSSPLWSR